MTGFRCCRPSRRGVVWRVPRAGTGTMAGLMTLVLSVGVTPARAQQTVATDSHQSVAAPREDLLRTPVTVAFDRVSLKRAVSLIASAARLRIQYQGTLLDEVTKPMTLHAERLPVGEAFSRVLAGTGMQVLPVAPDIVIIQPAGSGGQGATASDGGIQGRVTDGATKRPVAGASVTLDGTKYGGRTGEDGTYRLTGIPAGTYRLLVRRIGYRVSSVPVEVKDDDVQKVFVSLTATATVLNDVVTTATGDHRRFEVGNAVGTIHADSIVPTTMIRNVSDLLQARIPGVVVSNTDGAVGAPSKIRLRGVNSISLNNDPIVIVDGVRLNSQATSASLQTNVGSVTLPRQAVVGNFASIGTQLAPSRLDDIDPNTIESIDVLRGPSASSLYGTDAANGVIVIKTKRGQAGSWRSNISGDNGTSWVPGTMPELWWGWGNYNGGLLSSQCNLAIGGAGNVASGTCVQDSVTQFNPQNNANMRTLGTGTNRSISADLSGGTESLQQFFSARTSSVVGMAKMSDAESRLIARLWSSPAPSWMTHPNTEQDIDGNSRTTVNIGRDMDVSLSSNGIYRNVLNGGSGIQGAFQGNGASPSDTLSYVPSESQRTKVTSTAKHGLMSLTLNYRPRSWLSLNSDLGGDYTQRVDGSDLRAQDCSVALAMTQGSACPSFHSTSRGETFVRTANVGAQLSFTPLSQVTLRTALGEQYSHTDFYNLQAGNSNPFNCPLAFGSTLLTPAPVCLNNNQQQFSVNESRDESATAGVYLEETVTAFGLYWTFGVRQDIASAFGGQVTKSPPNYPKFNFSYPLSERSFFPRQSYVSSLRLRVAYGQSGNQASQTAILNSYGLSQSTYPQAPSTSSTAVLVTQLGNPKLRPEKGTEWEGGFDISFLENERIHAEFTMSRKYTRDAINQFTLAPSYGADNLSQYVNLGNVENRGVEWSVTAKILDTRQLGWDLTINGFHNTNKLVHKSSTLDVNGPLNTQFHEGYPLFGYWGVPVESYYDANGDSVLALNEIKFGSLEFMGAPYPRLNMTYANSVSLWNGAIRVNANVEQISGQTTQLVTRSGGGWYFPRGAVDRSAPLGEQAAYVQAAVNNGTYLGESSSLRLNELSVTYTLPAPVVRRMLHARSLAVTAAGRNLALWSSYAGKDPNVDTSGFFGDATQDNALGTPQPRIWTFRFNLGL